MQDVETMPDEYADYAEHEGRAAGGRVLWGRFTFWGVLLVLMFLLGRWSAPGGDESRIIELEQQVAQLQQENQQLQEALEAREAGGTEDAADDAEADEAARADGDEADDSAQADAPAEEVADAADEAAADEAAEDDADAVPTPAQSSYTVVQGDTLHTIAERMYGDPRHSALIAEANGLELDSQLQVGQELELPSGD